MLYGYYLQVEDTFQCHQLLLALMHMISLEQNQSLGLRSKHSEVVRQEEEIEFDYRQYRYLLFVFADNLNRSLKMHRDCLGEMDYHPKFRISKEEQDGYESSLLDIFQKYSSKLLKESVYRNTFIKKSCEGYLGEYEKVFPCTAEAKASRKNTPSMGFLRKMVVNDGKKAQTLSARSQTRKTVSPGCAQDKLLLLSQTFKAFQADLSMTLKLKTISSDNPQSKDCFLRATRSTISRNDRLRLKSDQFPLRKKSKGGERNEGEGFEETCFKGNEILISDHRKLSEQWEYQKEVPFHSKFCTKRVVAIGQSQKKAISDLEISHMQARNIETGIFWPPAAELNHRPKFKRWQHSFS